MMIGYARVSVAAQDTALQIAAMRRAGVRSVREEKAMGADVSRPVLERLLRQLRPGDVVVVYKVDRLARSLHDLLRILERIDAAGASFRSLTEPFETGTPVGRLLIQLLGVVAEFERAMIRERCEAGRRAARDKGVQFGRPPLLRESEVLALSRRGYCGAEAAKVAGVSSSALYRAARKYGVGFKDGRGGLRERSV